MPDHPGHREHGATSTFGLSSVQRWYTTLPVSEGTEVSDAPSIGTRRTRKGGPQLAKRTLRSLTRRLASAGFGRDFLSSAILPEWWGEDCWEKQELLPELEIRAARFLGVPVSMVADPSAALAPPMYQGAQLRRVRDIDRDRLGPAIHAAMAIAAAVLRNLKPAVPEVTPPPRDGPEWRGQIHRTNERVTLENLLGDLWARGIPVIPIDVLPAPSFQGLAALVQARPVIVVGHKHDDPGRAAFRIAHEAGHIASGDCTADAPVVDEDEEIASDHEMEERADHYAIQVLTGRDEIPVLTEAVADSRDLAKRAVAFERETGADAGAVIFAWARSTGDYATATMATKSLYRASGGRRILREHFERYVDVDGAPQSDQELLRAVIPVLQPADASTR